MWSGSILTGQGFKLFTCVEVYTSIELENVLFTFNFALVGSVKLPTGEGYFFIMTLTCMEVYISTQDLYGGIDFHAGQGFIENKTLACTQLWKIKFQNRLRLYDLDLCEGINFPPVKGYLRPFQP